MRSWKQKNKDKEFSATQIATKTVEELQKVSGRTGALLDK